MAVIKAAKSGKSLKAALDYVEKKAEIVTGKDCSDNKKQALEDMQYTKELHDKTDGRQYKHYIQSFAPGETTPEQAHKIGQEWAEKNFKGYEVYIATHTNKSHIHNHFIVNSVNFENGIKIHLSKEDLKQMKLENDQICEREFLSKPQLKHDQEFRSFDQSKYQLFKRIEQNNNIKSYVMDTAIAVDKAIETASDKSDFINKMNEQGYQVDWNDNHKHVTFHNKNGNKVRLSNLEKTFKEPKYSKEGLENEFSKPKEQNRTRTTGIPNIDWTAVENNVPSERDGLPKLISTDVVGAIQHQVRAVKERTNRAIEITAERDRPIESSCPEHGKYAEEGNKRIEAKCRKIAECERNAQPKLKPRTTSFDIDL